MSYIFFRNRKTRKFIPPAATSATADRPIDNQLEPYAVVASYFSMLKEVFVSYAYRPAWIAALIGRPIYNFDGRSEIVRRAAHIGLALIRDNNLECDDHHTFEDRNVRFAVRVDPTLRRHLTLLADQYWTTRAGLLRAALHYGLWKLSAHSDASTTHLIPSEVPIRPRAWTY